MKRGVLSILLAAAALLPSTAAGAAILSSDESGTEQPAEDLEELTAERDDLRAQLATKNQEFLVQHSRADKLQSKVAVLRKQLEAELQKEQVLQQKLNQVRSLVNSDSEGGPVAQQSAPAAPCATQGASQESEVEAPPKQSARPPQQPPAPSSPHAAAQPASTAEQHRSRGAEADSAKLARPASATAQGADAQKRVVAASGKQHTSGRPTQPQKLRAGHASRAVATEAAQAVAPVAAVVSSEAKAVSVHVHADRAELQGGRVSWRAPARPVSHPKQWASRSRSSLISELKQQVTQMDSRSRQATETNAVSASAREAQGKADIEAKAPQEHAESSEQTSSGTDAADFDELENQLHEEDRKIDELDTESQDDTSLVEEHSTSRAESESLTTATKGNSSSVDEAESEKSSATAGSDASDDSLFFSQLSTI